MWVERAGRLPAAYLLLLYWRVLVKCCQVWSHNKQPPNLSGLQNKGLFLPVLHVGCALAVVLLHILSHSATCPFYCSWEEQETDCTVTFGTSAQIWPNSCLLTVHWLEQVTWWTLALG